MGMNEKGEGRYCMWAKRGMPLAQATTCKAASGGLRGEYADQLLPFTKGVGTWRKACTCPDSGKSYMVGDDEGKGGCSSFKRSCVGGTISGTCDKEAATASPTTMDRSTWSDNVEWGGITWPRLKVVCSASAEDNASRRCGASVPSVGPWTAHWQVWTEGKSNGKPEPGRLGLYQF